MRIYINNGKTEVSVREAIEMVGLDQIALYMDDDIREQIHRELAPCTEEEFLAAYMQASPVDIIIG